MNTASPRVAPPRTASRRVAPHQPNSSEAAMRAVSEQMHVIAWLNSDAGYHAINAALWALFGALMALCWVAATGWTP